MNANRIEDIQRAAPAPKAANRPIVMLYCREEMSKELRVAEQSVSPAALAADEYAERLVFAANKPNPKKEIRNCQDFR